MSLIPILGIGGIALFFILVLVVGFYYYSKSTTTAAAATRATLKASSSGIASTLKLPVTTSPANTIDSYGAPPPPARTTPAAPNDVTGKTQTTVQQIESMALSLVSPDNLAAIGISMVGQTIKDKILKKSEKKVESSVATKMTEKALKGRASKVGQVALEDIGKTTAKKVASKAAAKAGEQAAAKAGTRAAAQAGTAGATGPGAPFVEAAELAFNMITGYMDSFNLGGFQNITTMEVLNSTRDAYNKSFDDSLKSNGLIPPLIIGPIDMLDSNLVSNIISNQVISQTTALMAPILARMPTNFASTDESNAWISNQFDLINNDNLYNTAYADLCKAHGGVMVQHPVDKANNFCTWDNKKDCTAPFPTPIGQTYYEFDPTMKLCKQKLEMMREKCEALGFDVTYNVDTGSCNLTDKYCRRYGEDQGVRNGDCSESSAESIASTIFGTAFVHGIVNVFDFSHNYEACKAPDHAPVELYATEAAVGAVTLGVGAAAMAGGIATIVNTMCASDNCPPGQEKMMGTGNTGGMCYENCKAGYSSGWNSSSSSKIAGMCYKDCPEGYDPTSDFCTRKLHVITDTGTPSSCPSGYTQTTAGPGGLCQPKCVEPGFTKSIAGICYNEHVDPLRMTQAPIKKCHSDANVGYDGVSCYRCNRDGRDRFVAGSCRHGRTIYPGVMSQPELSCNEGYTLRAGMCYAQSRPIQVARSLIDIGVCPAGKEKLPGQSLCYPACSTHGQSYHRVGVGCQVDNLSLHRDSYSRPPKGSAYYLYPRKRTVPFASTSESDFKNSALGSQIQLGLNSAAKGDMKGLGLAIAGAAIVGSPGVQAMGLGVAAGDMVKDQETKAGVNPY